VQPRLAPVLRVRSAGSLCFLVLLVAGHAHT